MSPNPNHHSRPSQEPWLTSEQAATAVGRERGFIRSYRKDLPEGSVIATRGRGGPHYLYSPAAMVLLKEFSDKAKAGASDKAKAGAPHPSKTGSSPPSSVVLQQLTAAVRGNNKLLLRLIDVLQRRDAGSTFDHDDAEVERLQTVRCAPDEFERDGV